MTVLLEYIYEGMIYYRILREVVRLSSQKIIVLRSRKFNVKKIVHHCKASYKVLVLTIHVHRLLAYIGQL